MPPRKTTTAVTAISKISSKTVQRDAGVVVIHGDELGRKYDLSEGTTTFGRSSKADIQVDNEAVSRLHARLDNHGGQVTLTDLGSTNGTFVNDETIAGVHKLRHGDLIKVGRSVFKFLASNNLEAAYHDEVYRLTTVDGLTQVFNRRYFDEALDRELSRVRRYGRGLSLVLIDIDKFKRINDEHGHLAGDAVLKEVASTLKAKIRREDVLARYGGEEFALLLPEIELKGALAMAEKARKLIEHHSFAFDGVSIPVTISLGVSALAEKGEGPKPFIQRADERLYEAKTSGRNRVCG